MNTDTRQDLIEGAKTARLLGCAIEVLNVLGHGFLEKVYENALCAEFARKKIPFEKQRRFPVLYKGRLIGEYIPDLLAMGIVVETKTVERLGESELGQMLNYLKITGCSVGLILNFRRQKLEWKRVVL